MMKIVIEIPEAYEYAFKGGDHLSYTLARVSGDIMKLGFHECGPYEKGIVEMLREALEHCEPLPDQTRGTRLAKEEDDGAVFTFDRANVSPDVIALIEDA